MVWGITTGKIREWSYPFKGRSNSYWRRSKKKKGRVAYDGSIVCNANWLIHSEKEWFIQVDGVKRNNMGRSSKERYVEQGGESKHNFR